jgi:UPF0148 protein
VEDKKVAKMAEALLAGGKMLPLHCGKCGGPLFEREGKIECAVCGEKVATVKPETKPAAGGEIERILVEKLEHFSSELRKETDPRKISELLSLMKSTIEVYEKLKVK